ncbi:hypothetical protein F4604DRAFT_1901970 [Suillus subluteus]|nr:hypothetical protein F4604DRAFT_1901970 [Suillus subluteus]
MELIAKIGSVSSIVLFSTLTRTSWCVLGSCEMMTNSSVICADKSKELLMRQSRCLHADSARFTSTPDHGSTGSLEYTRLTMLTYFLLTQASISPLYPTLLASQRVRRQPHPPSYPGNRQGRSGGSPGSYSTNPPPPYTKDAGSGNGSQRQPGFWTSAALEALGNHLLNRPSESLEYDREWERRLPVVSQGGDLCLGVIEEKDHLIWMR